MGGDLGAGPGRVVWWSGSVPSHCDRCAAELRHVFIDCKTVDLRWGFFCLQCAGEVALAAAPPLTRAFQRTGQGWVSVF